MKPKIQKKRWFSMLATGQILLLLNIISNTLIDRVAEYHQLQVIGIFFFVLVLILWPLPYFTLRKFGEISSSGSFLATTKLVEKGIYKIIRHPQYLSFMLLNIGMALINQDVITIVISIFSTGFLIAGIKEEENILTEQFGTEYTEYRKRVPSINIFSGIFRLL